MNGTIIHYYEGSWWFWDEIWTDRVGPFKSYGEAQDSLSRYLTLLDKERID